MSDSSSEGQEPVTSSNLVEIKQLRSMLKFVVEQLDFISISSQNARQELIKLKKVLKPRTCPCERTCTCKACNDLDSCFRDVQEIVQAVISTTTLLQSKGIFMTSILLTTGTKLPMPHAHDWDI